MKNVVYYFTGSGNSLAIAKDIAHHMEDTEVVRITHLNVNGLDARAYERVGIVYPIYYSGLPFMVREFVKHVMISSETYVFAVANYGDLIDIGMDQLGDLMRKKGTQLDATFEITMPGNYVVMFDTDHQDKVVKNDQQEKVETQSIAEKVLRQERTCVKSTSLATQIKGNLIYSIFKPYKMDRKFWVNEKCNGCGVCSRVCPAKNINMIESKPTFKHTCEHCLGCLHACPQVALQYGKGTVNRQRYKHERVQLKELMIDENM